MSEHARAGGLRAESRSLPVRLRQSLTEALEADVADQALEAACTREGLSELPTLPAQMATFVRGPLNDELTLRIGADAAKACTGNIGRLLGLEAEVVLPLDSGIRPRRGHSMAPPSPEAPTVVVASPDLAQVDRLIAKLQDRAKVVAAYDALALLSALQRDPAPVLVALDRAMPEVEGTVRETVFNLLGTDSALLEPRFFEAEAVAVECLAALEARSDEEPITQRVARPAALAPRTVLVAHSSGAWRDNISRVLRRAGWRPMTAPDGLRALDRCLEERPVAAIVQLDLPTFAGGALIEVLRARLGASAPAVIAIAEPGASVPEACVATVSEAAPRDVLACLEERFVVVEQSEDS